MPRVAKEDNNIYAILGLLEHEPSSGYDLKKRIEASISFFWPNLSYNKIYPLLKKLEKKELVTKKVVENEKRPDKKVYSLTKKGKEKLSNWINSPPTIKTNNIIDIMQNLLLKVFFGSITDIDTSISLIQESANIIQEKQLLLQKNMQQLEQILNTDIDHVYYYISAILGIEITRALKNWSIKATEVLNKEKTKIN